MMDEKSAAKVHALTFTVWWCLLYFIWKAVICVLYVIGIDYDHSNSQFSCALVAMFGIWLYTATAVYLFYFIYIKNNGQNPYFFRDPVEKLSFFIPIIHPNISQRESKYFFIKYLLFFIGITMVLISIILDYSNIKMNDTISVWYTICFIPLFMSIIMHQIWVYAHPRSPWPYTISTFISFVLMWTLIFVILQNDFNKNVHSLYITLPIIILSICLDVTIDFTFISQTQMVMFLALFCFLIPVCLMTCSWIAFISLYIIYFTNDAVFTMSIVFIPIWVIFLFEACHLCFGVGSVSSNAKDFILIHKYGKGVVVSSLDDKDTLNKLNKALQYKRDTEIGDNKIINLSSITNIENNVDNKECDHESLMINKVLYRLRCKDIVADIISPNHASLDKEAYQIYTGDDVDIDRVLTELYNIDKTENEYGQMRYVPSGIKVDESCFYQWIPTQFQIRFKDNVNCVVWKDIKTEYIDIKLNSLYIADVNQFKYETLNEIIVTILKTKIVSLFIHSIVGCSANEESDEYKQLLFEWCDTKKILNIIIKSQQYEFGDNTEWDYDISGDYHIDGTLQEKVSHIAILYADIDDSIRGGDLNLAFDSYLHNVWKFKPKKSSIIVFPNMYHKIDKISVWKWNKFQVLKAKQKRRILSFFLCSDKYFPSTIAYHALSFNDSYGGDRHSNVNQRTETLSTLPLLTTNDVFPFDKEHCNLLLTDILSKIWKDVPNTIIDIIKEYIMDNTLLRNETEMEMNARRLREYRRHFEKFHEARRPMVCD